MRIWIINHFAVSPLQSGGTRHYSLAKRLREYGHDVVIIASNVHYQGGESLDLGHGESFRLDIIDGVQFLWLKTVAPGKDKGNFRRLLIMLHFAWRLLRRDGFKGLFPPDVIYGSTPHLFGAWCSLRIAERLGVPFVLEIRDLWPETLVDVGKMSRYHPLVLFLAVIESVLYRHADKIVVLLPGAPDYLVARGVPRDRITWIPNGVELASTTVAPSSVGANRAFTVIYAGAHGVANGLDTLIDAAALIRQRKDAPTIRFRLIGAGPEKAGLSRRAADEGLENVAFEDPVSKQEIYGVLAEADAFYMPLKRSPVFRWGVSPNKLFDYMATSRPILFAVDTKYNPVADAKAGLTVAPDDPAALAEAIIRLAHMPEAARGEMGARGRAYVEQNHSFDRLGERLSRLLGEAVTVR